MINKQWLMNCGINHEDVADFMASCENADINGGINWTWIVGLTKDEADKLIVLFNKHGYEHRGISGDRPDLFPGYGIRFR